MPSQIRIGGTLTVDGVQITADTDDGYVIQVTKEDGSEFTDVEVDPTDDDGLNSSHKYIIDIPLYSDSTCNPGGAEDNETVIIHVYYNDTEYKVTSPTDGEIIVDAGESVAEYNLVAYSPRTLTMAVSPSESGTTDPVVGSHSYAYNDVVDVVATPATGYVFDYWIVNSQNYKETPASTSITMNQDKTVTAVFSDCDYTLTMAVNDEQMGSTDPEVGDSARACNGTVTITATPEEGYYFSGWIGDGIANTSAKETTVTMDDDKSVTANFTAITHNLTIGADDNGTTDPEAGTYEYAEGKVVTLTATPETGYVFSSWSGDVDYPYAATTTVTIDEDKTVAPVFDTDSDGDGKDDTSEQGPDGDETSYDGDDDGTSDSEQQNVVSTYNTDGTYYVTLSTDAAYTLTATPVMNPASTDPSSVTMDYGYFDINVSGLTAGGSATVTITYPSSASTPDTYYKYGPTPDNTTSHWYEFLYDSTTETGAEFSGNTITLHFVDGLRGDDDLDDTNGIIDDPGGAGRVVVDDTDDDDDVADDVADGGGGGGGGGIFGEISIRDVLGYHFDGNTSDGIGVYMPVTNAYKALKGAQTHVEGFAPNVASFVRDCFDSLEQKAENNKDGILYRAGTYTFPALGKIAEFYLDIVDAENLKNDAYADTTISIEEFKALEQQGKAVAPHRVNFEDETDKAPVQK